MPYKTGKLKGQLTTAEIRKLIRGHNILTSIKIPKGADRDDIIKIIENKGYSVNHEKKSLDPKGGISKGRPKVKLQKAQELTKPKPKTELQKQKAAESKAQKEEKRKKEEREIRKKAVQEEKARSKPKPKPKTTTIETQTETKTEKPKPKPKRKPDDEILKENGYPTLKEYREEIKRLRGDKILSELPLKQRKEIVKYVEKIAKELGVSSNINASPKDFFDRQVGNLERQFQFLAQEIREGKKPKKEPKKETLAIEDKSKEKKPEKNFKVERFERTKMINQLSQEIGKKFNPFKILGITASQETPELVKSRCRELRLKEHPDKGGSKEKFDLIQKACKILLDTQKIKEVKVKSEKKPSTKPEEMKGFEILSNFLNNNLKKRIKIINDYLDGKITEDKREELENDIIDILDTDMRQKVDSMFLEPNFSVKSKYLKSLQDQSLVKELKSILNKKPKPKPKKKEEPKKTSKLEKEFKKFQMAETLIKEFLDDNKGWENKDYSSLKNLRQYEDTFKNYDKFLKAYNTMNVMKAKREFNRERVEKLRDEIVGVRNKIRKVYDNRKN